ncbi:type I methionyl aminopeptidase [Candidatus Daviesbacteria bacterium]|nr:type I methionyl aminopeptidase [Candidatus Daviesbacteria bacterium]
MSRVLIRSKDELGLMRKSGLISAKALKKTLTAARPSVSLAELDKIAEEEIIRLGGQPSFKTVPGYFWTTCLTINDEVVHGTPRDIKLKEGDVLGVDLGAIYQGWHSDTAWSIEVGGSEKNKFLEVGEKTLWEAITQAREGNRIGDISSAIQKGVEKAGYDVVKSLAGHGVGRQPHEDPEIPEFGKAGTGLKLKSGMTLAIEVIYAQGRGTVYEKDDGWTIATSDGSLGGLFEMSVIVGKKKGEILTDWRTV